MPSLKSKIKPKIAILAVVLLINPVFLVAQQDSAPTEQPDAASEESTNDIQAKIRQQKEAMDELQKKIDVYQKQISSRRQEAVSIKNEIGLLEDQISETKLQLELKRREITSLNLKIAETEKRIEEKEEEMTGQKEKIAEFVRLLYQSNQKSNIEIMLGRDGFGEFFDQQQHLQNIEENMQLLLQKLKTVREKLAQEMESLENQRKDLEKKRDELTQSQAVLEGKTTAQTLILEDTRADEAKFQSLLSQVRTEQAQINSQLVSLEKALRQKLVDSGDKTLSGFSGQGFIWPIPGRTITSGFHDPDYPFRRYFEHPAIDIRTKQGTAIKAIGSGYVSVARDAGMGYSYISIVHADGLSSVYGHVSCISVKEDEFVVQGQTIGCSGGTPGTPGAGRLTTGAHLHLEIRLNGIPLNPLDYLP